MSESNSVKLYTKTGDTGSTNLYDMARLPKYDMVFEVLGDLDELSSCIGIVCSLLKDAKVSLELRKIQSVLLDIGSDFATRRNRHLIQEIDFSHVKQVEALIDFYSERSPLLTEFILPGVEPLDAHVHLCRSVSRRTERHMWRLSEELNGELQTRNESFQYINRLSDYFFALARYLSGNKETTRSAAKNN